MPDTNELSAVEVHDTLQRIVTEILQLGMTLIVHDDGHISWATSPNTPIVLTQDQKKKKDPMPLCTYMTDCRIPGALILNPLNESVGEMTSEKRWYYSVTNMAHSMAFAQVIRSMLETAVAVHNGTFELKDPYYIHALQNIVGAVDSKTEKELAILNKKMRNYDEVLDEQILEEFNLITKVNIFDFVTIAYNKKSRTASLVTCFQDEEETFKKQFGTRIRKKTWQMLEDLFREIYAVEDLTKAPIEVQINDLKCPQFRAHLELLTKAWSHLLPFLRCAFDETSAEKTAESVVFLESCLPLLPKLIDKGRWIGGGTMKPIELSNGDVVDKNTEVLVDPTAKNKSQPVSRQVLDQPVGLKTEVHERPLSTMEMLTGKRKDDNGWRQSDPRTRFTDRQQEDERPDFFSREQGRFQSRLNFSGRGNRFLDEPDDGPYNDAPRSALENAALTENYRSRTRNQYRAPRNQQDYFDRIV
jgi:hypothetical protein